VGSHARQGLTEKLLGTVADRVLRGAGRPVLLLPRAARDRWTQQP
jgi:nucleotide-binding universal stress UspA family protein